MARIALKESSLVLLDAIKDPDLHEEIKEHILREFNVGVIDVQIRTIRPWIPCPNQD